jgi:tetratricopeptide (TPR) repeat protein
VFCSAGLRLRFLLGSSLFIAACHRAQPIVPGKIAVLRFENLSPDRASDWAGRAVSEILGKELGAASFAAIAHVQQPLALRPLGVPGVSAEETGALLLAATDTVTGYYTAVNGNFSVTAIEENSATGKTVRSLTAQGDIFSVTDSLARAFTPSPKPFSTRNAAAMRLYALGLESGGPEAASDFEQAAAADPNFSDAYLAWTRAAAAAGNRTELERALAAANARGSALQPLDRAFLNSQSATLHQDAPALIEALTTIVKLSPAAPAQFRALADAEVAARRLQPAIGHFRQALTLTPGDVEIRNLLAYTQMFADDYAGALASIRDYQKLKPEDPNALDSEGDIHFYFGKFNDAERLYLQSFAKRADFNAGVDAWKAARAHLMTGDVPGATQLFQKFRDARQKAADPSTAFRDAEWQYLTGNRTQGAASMIAAASAATNPEVRSLCLTQAAIWELAAGLSPEANRHAALALQIASGQTGAMAGIARFLSQPKRSASEWRAAAERGINGTGVEKIRGLAAAYAYLLSREFTDAVPAWKAIYENTNPSDQAPGFFYAWSLVETGQAAAAAPILKTNPIPAPVPAASFECLYFPALFAWRGDQATFTKLGSTPAPVR